MSSLASCHLPQSGKYFMLLHACMILEFSQIYYVFEAFYQFLYFMCTLPICDKFKIYCLATSFFPVLTDTFTLCTVLHQNLFTHILYYDWLFRHSILCTEKLKFAFIVWQRRGQILLISKSVAFIFTDVNIFFFTPMVFTYCQDLLEYCCIYRLWFFFWF